MFRVLRYIYEIYKEKSFSRAAEKLFISQSSLSLTVKRFEQEIGIQIFDRSTIPLQLTEAGEVYMEGLLKILSIQRGLEEYVDEYKELKTGRLILGAANMFSCFLIPPLLGNFLLKYPGVQPQIIEADLFTLEKMAVGGEIDLLMENNVFDETVFESVPIFTEHLLLAVPLADPINSELAVYGMNTQNILANKHTNDNFPCVPLERFKEHKFILLGKGHDINIRAHDLCADSGFTPNCFMALSQMMTIFNLADQQLGVSIISDTSVKLTGKGQNLVFYKLSSKHAVRQIYLAYKRNRYMSHSVKAFIDMMKEYDSRDVLSIQKKQK